MKIKSLLLNIFGFLTPTSAGIYSVIEKSTPVLQWIAILCGIGVAVTAMMLNIKKYRSK